MIAPDLPSIISEGTVVKKPMGIMNINTKRNVEGKALIGYLPEASKARKTSVAFHVFTNQILVAAIRNQTE